MNSYVLHTGYNCMFRYAFRSGLVLVLAISGAVGRVSGFLVILQCVVGPFR